MIKVGKTQVKRPRVGVPEREARIRKRNEAKILEAAVELFARKGFDGTRVKEIASLSGLAKANVYYYFPSKGLIYERLIEQVLARWDAALEHIVPEAEPRTALTAYVIAKLDYSRIHKTESCFFANEILRGGAFLSAKQKAHMNAVTKERTKVLEGWIEAGKMRPMDPHHFFIMLWAATQYYAEFEPVAAGVLGRRFLTRADYHKAADTILSVMLDGCFPRDSINASD